ncbi:hypothetical protein JOQ06_023237, partial [Pogonophryne albipinna]
IHTFKQDDYHPCWREMKLAQSWSHLALHVSSHHICTALSLGLLGDLRCLAEAGLLCL